MKPDALAVWLSTMILMVTLLHLSSVVLKNRMSRADQWFALLTIELSQSLPIGSLQKFKGSQAILIGVLLFGEIIFANFFLSEYFTQLTVPPMEDVMFNTFKDLAEKDVKVYLREDSHFLRFDVFKRDSPNPTFARISPKVITFRRITETIRNDLLACQAAIILDRDRIEIAVKVRLFALLKV